eukprot:64803-Hanusia_phi.AAC.1
MVPTPATSAGGGEEVPGQGSPFRWHSVRQGPLSLSVATCGERLTRRRPVFFPCIRILPRCWRRHHQKKVTVEKEKESFQVPSSANVTSPVRNTICEFAPKEIPKFNGECDVNRSVVSWFKDVEHQLQCHRASPDQWVGAAMVAFGNVPRTWFTSLPSDETERFSIESDTWEEFTQFMIER